MVHFRQFCLGQLFSGLSQSYRNLLLLGLDPPAKSLRHSGARHAFDNGSPFFRKKNAQLACVHPTRCHSAGGRSTMARSVLTR